MAPQKTMAVSQQQQQQQQQALHQQTNGRAGQADQPAKSKKRKGKQTQISSNTNKDSVTAQQLHHQQTKVAPTDKPQANRPAPGGKLTDLNANKENPSARSLVRQPSFGQERQEKTTPSAKLNERTTSSNRLQKLTQEPVREAQDLTPPVGSIERSTKKASPVVAPPPPSAATTVIAKQISTDDQDDIDAGIELDGSSNSGSSVKDLNEDQIKSTSVSPVMAQSNLVNENRTSTKHAVEVAPMEQIAGSLCTDIAPGKKVGSLTKQQLLAANQQVIDADEQLLQQKLQSKQRKSSLQGGNSNKNTTSSANSNLNVSASSTSTSNSSSNSIQQQQQHQQSAGGANRGQAVVAQSPTLCRICEQHVYQMERMMAEKSVYHKSCFRCFKCKIQLRIDNYSSHEGQVYCKAHHRQIFQPQVNLDNEDDVDIVAKSTSKVVDDYLLHRGRLSDLSFSFLQPKPEGIRKRQMIICENEPAELPKDVVRSDTKVDDGIDRLNLNLGNIKERFERGAANSTGDESAPSSAGIVIEKPSFNLKKTLLAFETKTIHSTVDGDEADENSKRVERTERPVVRKLTNLNGFLNRQSSGESEPSTPPAAKPLAVRRSESLMMRLKKYESRIAGDQVANEGDSDDDANKDEDVNNNDSSAGARDKKEDTSVPKKLSSIDLSSLKSQWENGDINKRRLDQDDEANGDGSDRAAGDGSPSALEKKEELIRIRQQLARKRSGGSSSSIKNIYENAIKEAQSQKAVPVSRISDLSALNGFSTQEIQQQLLQNGSKQANQQSSTPSTPNKDHFQLNLNNKANKLRERFEQGLINNGSHDDSDGQGDSDNEPPAMTKLEQLRQEKMEDLSIFTEGEVRAREARSMFQQIDRRLSNGQNQPLTPNSRSLSSISASMQAKLQSKSSNVSLDSRPGSNGVETGVSNLTNGGGSSSNSASNNHPTNEPVTQRPIRLMNNVRT